MPKTSPAPEARPYRCTIGQYTKNLPRKVVSKHIRGNKVSIPYLQLAAPCRNSMPEPEREAEAGTEQTCAAGFGAAPAKAVPVNAPDAAKGQKRGRDEEDDAEMEMEAKNFDGSDDQAKPPQVQHSDWSSIEFIDTLLDTDQPAILCIACFFLRTDTDDFKMLSFYRPGLNLKNIFYGDWQYDTVHLRVTKLVDDFTDAVEEPCAGPQAGFKEDFAAAIASSVHTYPQQQVHVSGAFADT
jgi:hypothetical protein